MNDTLLGFILNIIACFGFGFMFAPLRNIDCKDGFFVQWVYSVAVFIVGFIVNWARGFPTIRPLAMVGGALSAAGSMAAVPLMQNLGLSIGMMLWGDVQAITGWSVARFGLFGTKPQPVYNNTMNVAGVIIVIVSGVMFAFVKHETQEKELKTKEHLVEPEKNSYEMDISSIPRVDCIHKPLRGKSFSDGSPDKKGLQCIKFPLVKLLYIGLAVVVGITHGFNMTPITYVIENDLNASHDVLDHIFAHYCAVTITTTVIFIIYCVVKRNKPYIYSRLVLPSFTYGSLWGGCMILFFISNRLLSQTVSYPITMRLPSTITLVADVLLFRTIKGAKNIIFVTLAVSVGIIGILLIAFSNQRL